MKTIKNILLVGLVLFACSCKKFLKEEPTSFLTPESNVSSVKVARAFANSGYQNLQGFLSGQSGSYGGNTWNLMEFMTGKSGSDLGQTGYVNYQNLTYSTTSFYFDTWWQQMYLGIGACNLAIGKIPAISAPGLTDEVKNNMLAEVKTLRALYYFQLVRMYGAVPMVTETPKDLNLNIPRTAAKDIYDKVIIPDLLAAEKSTLPWKDNTGKVSMGAVEALLADVYLTYAGAAINGADSAVRSGGDLKATGLGAGAGFATGLAAPLLAPVVGKGVKAIADNVQLSSIAKALGLDKQATKVLADAVRQDAVDSGALTQLGEDAMLMDLGPNLRHTAGAIAATPGEGKAIVRGAIGARDADANWRIRSTLDNTLGEAPTPSHIIDRANRNQLNLQPQYREALRDASGIDAAPIARYLDAEAQTLRGDRCSSSSPPSTGSGTRGRSRNCSSGWRRRR